MLSPVENTINNKWNHLKYTHINMIVPTDNNQNLSCRVVRHFCRKYYFGKDIKRITSS